jgi:eukaryotic-like serine/threonine-protein kinase
VRDLTGVFGNAVLKRIRNPARNARFAREVAALRALSHPNVVRYIDADLSGPKPYLVMEYCEGRSLADVEHRLVGDPLAALDLFVQICDGVAAAHERGIVHRDLKPANVLLRGTSGQAVVADFGIVYLADNERLTATAEAVGARHFIAPELADGRSDSVDPRSDVYSLGKLLYWLLAGRSFRPGRAPRRRT